MAGATSTGKIYYTCMYIYLILYVSVGANDLLGSSGQTNIISLVGD